MTNKIIFSVKDAGGACTTQTVHGKRASSTSSHRAAAEALARKLFPHAHQRWELRRISTNANVQVFELELQA